MRDYLKENEELFSILDESIEDSYIYMCDLKNDYSRWSRKAVDYFGLPGCYIQGMSELWPTLIHPEDRSAYLEDFGKLISKESDIHNCEYRAKNKYGVYVWLSCKGRVIRSEDGEPVLFAGAIENLGHMGKYDPTTNLKNINEFRADTIGWIQENKGKVGFLLLDVDEFSKINERYTYSFGNKVLKMLGQCLQESKPEGTHLYRMDGDKFVFACPDADEAALKDCFEKFQYILRNNLQVEDNQIRLTVSGGALLYPDHAQDIETIHRNLEYALQFSKRNKRAALTFFNDEILKKSLIRHRMTDELNHSIENGCSGFYLCFQPIIDTFTDKLYSCEALLRWVNKEGQVVSPMDFIPILESTGEIVKVGKWIIRSALAQLKEWHTYMPHLRININVSYLQFRNSDFKSFVMQQLAEYGISPEYLVLELTETCKIMDVDELKQEFEYFREQGVKIALDDFGTGYASVSVLKDLPIDWVKVDHGFVVHLMKSQTEQHIIEYLISLCQKLNIAVCVEGVENLGLREVVEKFGPESMQGYYFSRPLTAEDFSKQFIKQDGMSDFRNIQEKQK